MELTTIFKDHVTILRKPIKNSSIRVKANLEVIVSVPIHAPDTYIQNLITKRYDWIMKQLAYFKDRIKPIAQLISGEEIKYLGSNYRLKVVASIIDDIELSNGYLIIHTRDKDDLAHKQQLINVWYKKQAYELFWQIINYYQAIIGKSISKLTIRSMTSRWGSCNPRLTTINLSLELIKHPLMAIEYVIMHELTHLTHHYHDKDFYSYLTNYMPDWQSRRVMLNS